MAEQTQAIAGYSGKVYVGSVSSVLNEVAEIGHWTANWVRNLLETPKFQQNVSRIYGKEDFTGSFDGSWYLGDTDGQKVLEDAISGGTTLWLKLEAEDGETYECWALVGGETIDVPHDGSQSISFDFSSNGKVVVSATHA